jgi:hypothetical protein
MTMVERTSIGQWVRASHKVHEKNLLLRAMLRKSKLFTPEEEHEFIQQAYVYADGAEDSTSNESLLYDLTASEFQMHAKKYPCLGCGQVGSLCHPTVKL